MNIYLLLLYNTIFSKSNKSSQKRQNSIYLMFRTY
nr:MAG TPA: hypothetical protein [Caudoviricetes sp.]